MQLLLIQKRGEKSYTLMSKTMGDLVCTIKQYKTPQCSKLQAQIPEICLQFSFYNHKQLHSYNDNNPSVAC
jgi:hypothetical protein